MPKQHRNAGIRGKNFEKGFAEKLKDNGIDAERIERITNYSISLPDVLIKGHENLKIDCKFRAAFSSSKLFEQEVIDKYVKEKTDRAIMPMKYRNQRGFYVLLEDDFFIELLKLYLDQK